LDLLARLQGHQFTLWPLRDRIEDFGILIHDLLRRSPVSSAKELGVSVQAARWLLSQRWLLNIRELSQVLGGAPTIKKKKMIERSHFPDKNVEMPLPPEEESAENEVDLRGRIVALLEKHKGNVSHVARDMGKARVQIHRWMQKLSIDVNDYRA